MAVRNYDLSPKAENDLLRIIEWYELKSLGLGILFLKEISQNLIEISKYPQIHKLVTKDVRRFRMKDFPYTIFFNFTADDVYVLRVRGNRQRPLKRYY